MSIGDTAAHGQPHARALVVVAAMQSLKHRKNLLRILLVETDAVVRDGQFTKFLFAATGRFAIKWLADRLRLNPDLWLAVGRLKFQRVTNKILQELAHLH